VSERKTHYHQGYGNFPGGDPRRFWPDPECSTEQERDNWKAACARWDLGNQTTEEPGSGFVDPQPFNPATMAAASYFCGRMHIQRADRFGLGTYEMECDGEECEGEP